MEKTTKKARLDREQLQNELNDLTGRSKGDAKRATEVGCVLGRLGGQQQYPCCVGCWLTCPCSPCP